MGLRARVEKLRELSEGYYGDPWRDAVSHVEFDVDRPHAELAKLADAFEDAAKGAAAIQKRLDKCVEKLDAAYAEALDAAKDWAKLSRPVDRSGDNSSFASNIENDAHEYRDMKRRIQGYGPAHWVADYEARGKVYRELARLKKSGELKMPPKENRHDYVTNADEVRRKYLHNILKGVK